MDLGLAGQRILVTGASGGIGSATARLLAGEGARVILHYHQGREAAEALAAELGPGHPPLGADLRREDEAEALFEAALEAFGHLDGLVVNAGIWPPEDLPLHQLPLERWQNTLDADLTGAFLCCRAFLRHLAERPREAAGIVLIGSTAALFGEAGHADYAAAKAGLAYGLTRTLKNEIARLAPRGRVNCVCPGWVDTRMGASASADPEALARVTATMSLRKIARPEDVAAAVAFLLSDRQAGHLSGTVLPLAGGMEGRLLWPEE